MRSRRSIVVALVALALLVVGVPGGAETPVTPSTTGNEKVTVSVSPNRDGVTCDIKFSLSRGAPFGLYRINVIEELSVPEVQLSKRGSTAYTVRGVSRSGWVGRDKTTYPNFVRLTNVIPPSQMTIRESRCS